MNILTTLINIQGFHSQSNSAALWCGSCCSLLKSLSNIYVRPKSKNGFFERKKEIEEKIHNNFGLSQFSSCSFQMLKEIFRNKIEGSKGVDCYCYYLICNFKAWKCTRITWGWQKSNIALQADKEYKLMEWEESFPFHPLFGSWLIY